MMTTTTTGIDIGHGGQYLALVQDRLIITAQAAAGQSHRVVIHHLATEVGAVNVTTGGALEVGVVTMNLGVAPQAGVIVVTVMVGGM